MVRITLILACACACALAQDATTDASGVADPFGLGERLALIDWLHDHGAAPAEGAELPALRAQYAAATVTASDHSVADREAAALELWRKHGRNPRPGDDASAIRMFISVLDQQAIIAEADERARQRRDDAAIPRSSVDHAATAHPIASSPANGGTPSAARADAPAGGSKIISTSAAVREIERPRGMGAAVKAYLISPDASPILVVVCDPSLRGDLENILTGWPAKQRLAAGVDGTIVVLCHSDGRNFSPGVMLQAGAVGGDLSEHLRQNRAYYESLGGTRERRPVDLAVMTGCNAGGFDQETQLRDGLGYRPLHRVFTRPECLGSLAVSLPAMIAAGSTRYDQGHPYRARYTYSDKAVLSGGKTYDLATYAVVDENALDIHDHLRRFTVSPVGLTEDQ